MRYYYDTEFHEDGSTIDLISIGIVAEDGREYYAVNRHANWQRIRQNPWLMKNVVPQLPPRDDPAWKPKGDIADEVSDFLRPLQSYGPLTRGFRHVGTPELWAWFGAYDHVALAQLFGRMIDFPDHIPMWTNDVRQEQHRLGNPGIPAQRGGLHNALADARHLRVVHESLIEYEARKSCA